MTFFQSKWLEWPLDILKINIIYILFRIFYLIKIINFIFINIHLINFYDNLNIKFKYLLIILYSIDMVIFKIIFLLIIYFKFFVNRSV